jgi:hypothetical protein
MKYQTRIFTFMRPENRSHPKLNTTYTIITNYTTMPDTPHCPSQALTLFLTHPQRRPTQKYTASTSRFKVQPFFKRCWRILL